MQKNVASQILVVYVWDSTTGLPKTGDAANLTAYRSLDGGAVTVLADTSATEIDSTNAKGYYKFDLAQGETNGNVILFTCKSATANMVCRCTPDVVQTVPTSFVVAPGSSGALLVGGSNAATTFSTFTVTGASSFGTSLDGVTFNNLTVTQGITSNITGNLSGSVGSVATGGIAAASFAAGAINAAALAADAVAEIWTTTLTEAYAADGAAPTPAQFLFMFWSLLSEKSISGVTLTAKKLDGSTTSMVFTLNSATQPTSITRAS